MNEVHLRLRNDSPSFHPVHPLIREFGPRLLHHAKRRGLEPTNNATERALRQSIIQRTISLGVQSASGAICRSRLLTVTTTLRQQGRDIWGFVEQAWIAHHRGGVMPSLLLDP